MKNYIEQFESISTLKELYEFRESLKEDALKNEGWSGGCKDGLNTEMLDRCQNANFFVSQVESRINHLARQGIYLDKIELPNKEQTPEPSVATETK